MPSWNPIYCWRRRPLLTCRSQQSNQKRCIPLQAARNNHPMDWTECTETDLNSDQPRWTMSPPINRSLSSTNTISGRRRRVAGDHGDGHGLCGGPASLLSCWARWHFVCGRRWSRAAILPIYDERTMTPMCNIDHYILISSFIFSWHKFSHFEPSFLIIIRDSHFLFVHVSDIMRVDFIS